jgi:hypothetical protein
MAYTIDLDDDCISAEELQLMKTKQSILRKLRVRFGEYAAHKGWEAASGAGANESREKCAPQLG